MYELLKFNSAHTLNNNLLILHLFRSLNVVKMWKLLFFCSVLIKLTVCARLELSNDDVVIEAIRENRNLIVLFTKKGCVECKHEQSLSAMREEFESSLDAKVLKLESSQLQRVYDIQKQDAALVFIRKGVGLLYPSDGHDTPDEIFDFFNDNRDPIVKELDDRNFEHLTQASSGSTTGDWFIQFYDNQCLDCNRLTATWETVGAKLKTRMNIARVNRGAKGVLTAKRFKVEQAPEFILLRPGKYYRYNLKQYDIETFVSFATTWYNRLTAEKVATPSTPFEDVVDFIVKRLKDLPNLKILSMNFINDNPLPVLITTSAIFVFFVIYVFKSKTRTKPDAVKKTSKKE